MHEVFVALFNAGDAEGLLSLYEEGAVLNASPGNAVQGKDAIRAALGGFLSLGGKITIQSLAGFEAPGGIALTHGEWSLRGGAQDLGGKTAEVLRRQPDGRWLYITDNPWA